MKLSNALRTEALSDEAAFDLLADEWDQLLDDSQQRVYFLRPHWNRLWWRCFQPSDSRLFLITCRDESGRLVGLAPFYWRQRRSAGLPHIRDILFLGTGIYTQTSEYLDIIARRGLERIVAEEVANFLCRNEEWDRLWLNEIPAASAVLAHLCRAINDCAAGESLELAICNRSSYIDTQRTWNAFTESLSRSKRKNLAYYMRKVCKSYGCNLRLVRSIEEVEPAMDELVRLHQARWQSKGQPGSFALSGFETFLRETARAALLDDRLRMWTLELDGKVAAVRLGFFDNRVVHDLQGGFDPSYAKYSLGTVMHGLCIKDCIEDEAVREYDFMGGGDAYKGSWTDLGRESACLTWLRPGLRSLAYRGIEQAGRVGKSLARATLPATMRAAVRRNVERRHYVK